MILAIYIPKYIVIHATELPDIVKDHFRWFTLPEITLWNCVVYVVKRDKIVRALHSYSGISLPPTVLYR